MSQPEPRSAAIEEQYRTPANLNARMALHERFGTNRGDWFHWVFDHLPNVTDARVLELGCGPGWLWDRNRGRIPSGWSIVLSDASPGMCRQARVTLGHDRHRFAFAVIDAQALPLADGSCDIAIANHMLYHVPDRSRALAEVARVLRPGGRFFAATNGVDHMREVSDLAARFEPPLSADVDFGTDSFSLENGAWQLGAWFGDVERRDFEDGLVVTEAAPLVAYILSTMRGRDAHTHWGDDVRRQLTAFVEHELDRRGPLRVTKASGLFIATRPLPS